MAQGPLILEPQASSGIPAPSPAPGQACRRTGERAPALARDSIHPVVRDGTLYLVSENYSYRSEAYYTILAREIQGRRVAPDTGSILDAFVVPICLERARLAGIPVADYAISQSCIHVPSVVYGLNYFACTSHFDVLADDGRAREVVRHVTNNGKYPFCSQPIGKGVRIERAASIFGRAVSGDPGMADMASWVWECFRIPLVELVCLSGTGGLFLSSLCPVRYTHLPKAEKAILRACIAGQEFL